MELNKYYYNNNSILKNTFYYTFCYDLRGIRFYSKKFHRCLKIINNNVCNLRIK